jgi:hypothetical protein
MNRSLTELIQNLLGEAGARVTFVSFVDEAGDVETSIVHVGDGPVDPVDLLNLAMALRRAADYLESPGCTRQSG